MCRTTNWGLARKASSMPVLLRRTSVSRSLNGCVSSRASAGPHGAVHGRRTQLRDRQARFMCQRLVRGEGHCCVGIGPCCRVQHGSSVPSLLISRALSVLPLQLPLTSNRSADCAPWSAHEQCRGGTRHSGSVEEAEGGNANVLNMRGTSPDRRHIALSVRAHGRGRSRSGLRDVPIQVESPPVQARQGHRTACTCLGRHRRLASGPTRQNRSHGHRSGRGVRDSGIQRANVERR